MSRLGHVKTFDIECESWDKFVIGGAFDGKNYHSFRHLGQLLDYLLEQGGTWWGHYAGKYDMLALLGENAEKRQLRTKCHMAGSRITCAAFEGKLLLRDSFAIAPLALEKFAQIAGKKKTSPGLSCDCGEDCGGYCSIRRDMSPSMYRKVDSYMENDCVVLYHALTYWLDYLRTHFGEPKGTIGATSFAFTRQKPSHLNSTQYSFIKRSYFGGRCEVWKRLSPFGWHDDINSAYVDALRLMMPIGLPKECFFRVPNEAKYWISEAIVTVPDCHIPPLPLRGRDRLYFPTGKIKGCWNKSELEAAEQAGCTIEKLGRIFYWRDLDTPYTDFCERVWSLRAKAGKDTVLGKNLKSLSVSVAGKLAMRPEIREVIYSPLDPSSIDKLASGGGWENIGENPHWWSRKIYRVADCAHIHHASEMTAHVRIRLRERAEKEPRAAVYCDTDAVFTEIDIPEDRGTELGEFLPSDADKGHDGTYRNFRALAPKLVEYEERKAEYRAKGFSLGRKEPGNRFARIRGSLACAVCCSGDVCHEHRLHIDTGAKSLLKALNDDGIIFKRRDEYKQFHPNPRWIGGRIKAGEIETRPPHISEVKLKQEEYLI